MPAYLRKRHSGEFWNTKKRAAVKSFIVWEELNPGDRNSWKKIAQYLALGVAEPVWILGNFSWEVLDRKWLVRIALKHEYNNED